MHMLHSAFCNQTVKEADTAPSITFDQPPLLKALEIITAKKLDVVPFLGRFQVLISFYGRVDTIMAGLGIDKLSQNVYGENSVNICCQVR